jgi:hypothetical protein
VQDVLHVERDEEEQRVEAGHRDHLRDVGGREASDPQDREREQRIAAAQLVGGEHGEDRAGNGEPDDRAPLAPADVGRLDHRVDQQQHPGGHEHGAADVEVRNAPRPVSGDQPEDRAQDDEADGEVHEEHPSPVQGFRDRAAQEHADRRAETGDGAPCSERLVPVDWLGERGGQDRQRRGDHHRRAAALDQARCDQQAIVRREPGGERRGEEHDRAGRKDASTPEEIRGAASEQHQPAVGQQIAAEDPLQVLHREPEIGADRGQRDVDDGGVDEVQEGDREQQEQRLPSTLGLEDGAWGRGGHERGTSVVKLVSQLTYRSRARCSRRGCARAAAIARR